METEIENELIIILIIQHVLHPKYNVQIMEIKHVIDVVVIII